MRHGGPDFETVGQSLIYDVDQSNRSIPSKQC
ncbi:protein of unknown function [Hyphomicrobium sp. 1Nfss2.1]